MRAENKRLTILSDAEQEALYGLPDFDDTQRERIAGLFGFRPWIADYLPLLAQQAARLSGAMSRRVSSLLK